MPTQKLRLSNSWEEVREKLKETNIDLTDEDLEYEPGKEKELLERVAKVIGKDIAATKAWIESVSFNQDIASWVIFFRPTFPAENITGT